MKKKIRNNIGYCLKLIGDQQKDLAKFVGVTEMCVSRWVNGYNNPINKHIVLTLVFLNRHKPRTQKAFTEDDLFYFG